MKRAFVHGTLIPCDDRRSVLHDTALAIDGSRIVGIGKELPAGFHPDETVDCTGMILMPGLVNAHVHLGEHLFRGWMDEVSFEGLFYSTLFRWEAALNPDWVHAASLAAAIEAAKAGVTTVADMYHHAEATARAVDEVGLRALIGQKILGFALDRPPRETDHGIDYRFDLDAFGRQLDAAAEFAEAWDGACEGRIRTGLCAHATNPLTGEMLEAVARRAGELGLPVHMHLAQMASEAETVMTRDGMGCVELLDRCGILDHRFLGAHGIFVRPDEMALLNRPNVAIVHNPIANAKDAGLIAPIGAYQAAGVRIALGTDAFRMDLLEAARFAACIQRTTVTSGTEFAAREVLRWATAEGANALGIGDQTGSLEPGKAADLLVLGAVRLETFGMGDPHTQVLYYGSPSVIRRVYVNGEPVVVDGIVQTVDEKDAGEAFAKHARDAWRKEGSSQ